jgi:phosphohistidine phosphatase
MYAWGMEVYILRHGPAVERGTRGFASDAMRPLTPKGEKQLRKTAAALRKMRPGFDVIMSSPLLRAKQTAEIVADELKLTKRLKLSAALAPGRDPEILVAELNRLAPAPKKLLLVGHEPDLSRLVSLLTTGDIRLRMDFKKGGLCKLEAEKLRVGQCAALVWLLTPKQLKTLA